MRRRHGEAAAAAAARRARRAPLGLADRRCIEGDDTGVSGSSIEENTEAREWEHRGGRRERRWRERAI